MHPNNNEDLEFFSDIIYNRKFADVFYGIILGSKTFIDVRLEQKVWEKWITVS
jgi:hypothetical protein